LERKAACGSLVPEMETSAHVAYCCIISVWIAVHSHRSTQWSHDGSQAGSVRYAVLSPAGGNCLLLIRSSTLFAQPTKLKILNQLRGASLSVSYER